MRVLITGGAGCLGSNLAERLLAQGHDVAAIDNYATGRRDALAPHPKLKVVEGAVEDRPALAALFEEFKPTHVVHAAASYKDPDDWRRDTMANVLGSANVIQLAKQHGVRRFVYFETALVYGRAKTVPIPPDHFLQPGTSYAISKGAGERYLQMSGLDAVTLRLANIYGPRTYAGPVPAFWKRLRAGQPCTIVRTRRDFLAMDDFLSLMDKVLAEGAPRGSFNVSSEKDVTIEELYHLMMRLLEIKNPPPHTVNDPGQDDVSSLLLDSSATRAAFGWRPVVELEAGLRELVRWYDAHGVGETFTHLRVSK
jgi:UDP-glucose 4-epimerase